MKFSLNIDSDDQAMHDDPDAELARALEGVARQVACSGTFRESGPVLDSNGNTIGRWSITPD